MSDWLNLMQWPAMAMTVGAAWWVGSERPTRRQVGFWAFLVSNVMWVIWGLHASAPALVVLQLCLAALNIRGAMKAERALKRAEAGGSSDAPIGGSGNVEAGAKR